MIHNLFSKIKSIFTRILATEIFDYSIEYCSRPTTVMTFFFLILYAFFNSRLEIVFISILVAVLISISVYYFVITARPVRSSGTQESISRDLLVNQVLPIPVVQSLQKGQVIARVIYGCSIVLAFVLGLIFRISFNEIITFCLLISFVLVTVDVPLFLAYLYSKISRTMQVDLATMLLHKVLIYMYVACGVCIVSTLAVLGIALPLIFTPAFIIWIAVFVYIFVPVLVSFGFVDTTPEAFSHRIDTKSFLGLQISSRSFFFAVIGISLLIITFFMTQLHNGYAEALSGVNLLSVFLMWCGYICILRADSSLQLLRSSRDERLRIGLLLLVVVAESLVLYISFFKSAFHIQAPSIGYWIAAVLLALLVSLVFYVYRWLTSHFYAYHDHREKK